MSSSWSLAIDMHFCLCTCICKPMGAFAQPTQPTHTHTHPQPCMSFQVLAPNYRISDVVRQPQTHGPLPGLALYLSSQFRKCFHTNLPQAGFELGSLGPQAGMLPIELALLVGIGD